MKIPKQMKRKRRLPPHIGQMKKNRQDKYRARTKTISSGYKSGERRKWFEMTKRNPEVMEWLEASAPKTETQMKGYERREYEHRLRVHRRNSEILNRLKPYCEDRKCTSACEIDCDGCYIKLVAKDEEINISKNNIGAYNSELSLPWKTEDIINSFIYERKRSRYSFSI